MKSHSILISNVRILSAPETAMANNQWLLCANNLIHSFGPMNSIPDCPKAVHIDGTGKLLMPGLINGHNHCAMTLFRGLADDLDLGDWLNNHIFPAEAAHVNEKMVYWCTKLAAAEMILSGTTTVADGYFHEEMAAQALLESGMRAVPAQGIIDFPAPGVPNPSRNIETAEAFLTHWKNKDSKITPAVFAHSPYTCSPKTLRAAKTLAAKHQVPLFIHIAETRREQDLIIDPQGTSPVRHLAALGLLDQTTVLIHCVWLDERDKSIIEQSGAGVIVCPQSNFKLASGIVESSVMNSMGIPTGLGTDGSASNNSLDLFCEMDLLAKSQKILTLDATAMPAQQALSAATEVNARILGLSMLGKIAPGYKADLLLLDRRKPHLQPVHTSNSLVYSANGADVDTVIINGTIVLKNRTITTFDLDECMTKIRNLATPLDAI